MIARDVRRNVLYGRRTDDLRFLIVFGRTGSRRTSRTSPLTPRVGMGDCADADCHRRAKVIEVFRKN